jgi:hypothetical protein
VDRATRIVAKGLKKNLETIPGKHSIDSLTKYLSFLIQQQQQQQQQQ